MYTYMFLANFAANCCHFVGTLSSLLNPPSEVIRHTLDFIGKVQLCRDLGNALASLHGGGIVHGDIKPENILLSALGQCRCQVSISTTSLFFYFITGFILTITVTLDLVGHRIFSYFSPDIKVTAIKISTDIALHRQRMRKRC